MELTGLVVVIEEDEEVCTLYYYTKQSKDVKREGKE